VFPVLLFLFGKRFEVLSSSIGSFSSMKELDYANLTYTVSNQTTDPVSSWYCSIIYATLVALIDTSPER
jgi:hypothetical protein